jgi:protein PhnA
MKREDIVKERSQGVCELTGEGGDLFYYEVVPNPVASNDSSLIMICQKALDQIEKREEPDAKYWEHILPTTMWSEVAGVQVVAWRLLNRFREETWAADALEMLYIDEDNLEWAKASGDHLGSVVLHKDSNNNILQTGDTVTLIKDLDVKGSSLVAKVGTAVRNIRLVADNPEQIEGKIDGQTIVILTKYVKK